MSAELMCGCSFCSCCCLTARNAYSGVKGRLGGLPRTPQPRLPPSFQAAFFAQSKRAIPTQMAELRLGLSSLQVAHKDPRVLQFALARNSIALGSIRWFVYLVCELKQGCTVVISSPRQDRKTKVSI